MKDQSPLRTLAFWAALLCSILLLPQMWQTADWLSNIMLAPEFGEAITWWLRPLVFLCVLICGVCAARATLASSFGIIALTIITRLPI